MLAAIFYIAAVLLANLTATLFLPFEVAPGTGVLVSVGTLVFGLTFTQRDRLHSRGRRFVYSVIALAAVLNFAMLFSISAFWGAPLVRLLEELNWNWLAEGAAMLTENGWRVFIASFLAIVVAESADTEVFQYYRQHSWWGRVMRSNAVSIPIDSILFNLIAFAGSGFFPPVVLAKVILGEIVTKFIVGALWALRKPPVERN